MYSFVRSFFHLFERDTLNRMFVVADARVPRSTFTIKVLGMFTVKGFVFEDLASHDNLSDADTYELGPLSAFKMVFRMFPVYHSLPFFCLSNISHAQ